MSISTHSSRITLLLPRTVRELIDHTLIPGANSKPMPFTGTASVIQNLSKMESSTQDQGYPHFVYAKCNSLFGDAICDSSTLLNAALKTGEQNNTCSYAEWHFSNFWKTMLSIQNPKLIWDHSTNESSRYPSPFALQLLFFFLMGI